MKCEDDFGSIVLTPQSGQALRTSRDTWAVRERVHLPIANIWIFRNSPKARARTFFVDWFSLCLLGCSRVDVGVHMTSWNLPVPAFCLHGTRYWRVSIHSIVSAKNCFCVPFSDNMKTRDALHDFQPSWCCVTKFLQGHFWTFIIGKNSESQNQPITPAKFSPLDPRRMGLEYECLLGYASAAFSGFKAGVWYFEAAIFNTLAPSSTNIWRWYHDQLETYRWLIKLAVSFNEHLNDG